MEWNGTKYIVYGTPEQIMRIFTDAFRVHNKIVRTGEKFDKFYALHKDFIEAYCPLDRKESYVGELMFQLNGQNSIIIDDINNYDGFYLKPALVERYGKLEFESVQEFSLGGSASSRKESPREEITPKDARRMRAEEEEKSENNSVFNLNDTLSFVSSEKKNSNERFMKKQTVGSSNRIFRKSNSKNRKP